MILTRDKGHGDYEIHSYEKGKLKINETIYANSIILGTHVLEIWQPQSLQELTASNLERILDFKPDVVLLGTGEKLIFPESKLFETFYQHQIGIEVMSTLAACRTFNVLMSEGRNVIAALLIQ